MATLPDPIAVASGPISAYMSGHDNANLAYVKYFAKKTDAVSATFKSLNSKGFIVIYKTRDGSEYETFIEYNAPVKKREDLRPVLEDMAKKAEEALGMPSSLNGPPPFKAMMKAAEIEDAQKAEMEKLQENKGAEASTAIANIFDSNDPDLDVFYPAEQFWKTSITVGMGLTALLAYTSDAFLSSLLPSAVLQLRNYITQDVIASIFKWACTIHLVEGSVALGICLKRKWYSPINVLKWTISSTLYGTASMCKLLKHGKIISKKNN